MAMTAVDVCNNALGQIAHDRTITSLADGSREASLCNRLYPLTRRALLASRPWAWAQAEGAVSVAAGVTPSAPYTAAYTVPAGSLAVTAALSSTGVQLPFAVRGAAVHVDGTATTLRYTADMTDPAAWPAAFKDALLAEFAARLARAMPALAPRAEGLAASAQAALAGAEAAEDRAAGVSQDGADDVLDLCNAALALALPALLCAACVGDDCGEK